MGCPNCGYCPHCGRGGYQTYPWQPSYPWYVPYPSWTGYVVPLTSTGAGVQPLTVGNDSGTTTYTKLNGSQ